MTIQDELTAAIGTLRGTQAADTLCVAIVELFEVDAASISLIFDGTNNGTLGASSDDARRYDELQFTLGEGPCLDAVAGRTTVQVEDLARAAETRWPAYGPAMLAYDIRSVCATPVVLAGEYMGALDLYRRRPGLLPIEHLADALVAAELAAMPMLDLLSDDLYDVIVEPQSDAWAELAALTRFEVSQATGMLVAQLDVEPAEALVRLRGYAFAHNLTATDVARSILYDGLRLDD